MINSGNMLQLGLFRQATSRFVPWSSLQSWCSLFSASHSQHDSMLTDATDGAHTFQLQEEISAHPQQQQTVGQDFPGWSSWLHPQPNFGGAPQLCAVPKKRLTLHRRGHRRQWYRMKQQPILSHCSLCGAVGGRDQLLTAVTGNPRCTGRCLGSGNQQKYPEEYKPPS